MSLQGLGAAYGSSDSESDDDKAGTSVAKSVTTGHNLTGVSEESGPGAPTNSEGAGGRNFFNSDSDSSSDDDEGKANNYGRRAKGSGEEVPMARLPSAFEVFNKSSKSSIFHTKQAAEEEASTAVLEHHVKLTAAVVSDTHKERAPVCRAFKKGRCNKGERCRFSHVVAGGLRANEAAKNANPEKPDPNDLKFASAPVAYNGWEQEDKAKKRRKPGVTNTLLPAKKAMLMFKEQKAKEQPWAK